jgi:spore maturation protein SpmB
VIAATLPDIAHKRAAESQWAVETHGLTKRFGETVATIGAHIEAGPLGLGITLPAGTAREVTAEIARVLVTSGISLYRLQEMQASLESWFLQVTSRLGAPE